MEIIKVFLVVLSLPVWGFTLYIGWLALEQWWRNRKNDKRRTL
jgi:hypothetical protein